VAERSIQTVVSWARTLLLHAAINWLEMADLKLWPFAPQHAVYLWNILPDQHTKLSPLELISGSRVPNYTHLQQLHVWGCPTFVLDPRLQDGKKLPKWSPRSCLGCFLGYSTCHSSTVSLILNSKNGSVTPQYHHVQAMKVEITTLIKQKAWKVIPKTSEMRWKHSKIQGKVLL